MARDICTKTQLWGWSVTVELHVAVTPEQPSHPQICTATPPPGAPRPVLRGESAAKGKQGPPAVSWKDPVANAGHVRAESLQAATLRTAARRMLQARILERVAMPSSRGSSRPKDQTRVSCVSCISRRVLYHEHLLGCPRKLNAKKKTKKTRFRTARHVRRPFCCFINYGDVTVAGFSYWWSFPSAFGSFA